MREHNLFSKTFEGLIALSVINFAYVSLKSIFLFFDSLVIINPIISIFALEFIIYSTYIKDSREIRKTRISSVHALITFLTSSLFINNYISLHIWKKSLIFSIIFYILDLEYLYFSNIKIKRQMIIHHLIVLFCLIPIFDDRFNKLIDAPLNYNTIVAYNYLAEASTIPLNMGWILHAQKKDNTTEFKLYYLLTMILYIPFRLYSYTRTSLMILNLSTPIKYLQLVMTYLNYFWFWKMFQKALNIKIIRHH